jgi:site-specific DNA-methyltransferase (adenine-specific)
MREEIKTMDAINFLKFFKDNEIDLLLTDIPYDVINKKSNGLRKFDKEEANTLTFDLIQFLEETTRVVKGSIYIWCATEQAGIIRSFYEEHQSKFSTRTCVWEKTNPTPANGQYLWLSGVELCIYAKKPKATFNEHCQNTVWRFPNGRNKFHKTEKPIKLFQKIIKASSNPGDLVVDPCVGSGTTAMAAKIEGRAFSVNDINKKFTDYTKERLSSYNK